MANIRVNDKYSHGLLVATIDPAYCHAVENVSTNITLIMKARGWTQTDLACVAEVSQATISKAANGDPGVRIGTYARIAEALRVPLFQLFTDRATAAEIILLDAYRHESEDRRLVWDDMANAILTRAKTDDL